VVVGARELGPGRRGRTKEKELSQNFYLNSVTTLTGSVSVVKEGKKKLSSFRKVTSALSLSEQESAPCY